MSDNFFTGPWRIEYRIENAAIQKKYLTADYKVYTEERVLEILKEVHPDWVIEKIYKVEKLPWLD